MHFCSMPFELQILFMKKTPQVEHLSPRTPSRIAAAKRYREMVKHKDAETRRAVDLIVRMFVCPDEDGV